MKTKILILIIASIICSCKGGAGGEETSTTKKTIPSTGSSSSQGGAITKYEGDYVQTYENESSSSLAVVGISIEGNTITTVSMRFPDKNNKAYATYEKSVGTFTLDGNKIDITYSYETCDPVQSESFEIFGDPKDMISVKQGTTILTFFNDESYDIGIDSRDIKVLEEECYSSLAITYSPSNSTGTSNAGSATDREEVSSEATIPDEIKHCQWSSDGSTNFAESNSHLGSYTICQSTNKKDVWIQVKTPITDSQVCMIPTHNSGSSSVYVGEPRCLMLSEAKKIYKITLYSNRSGYQNFSITGVMVMKDKSYFYPAPFYQYVLSPDAYIYCSQFLDKYNDPSFCNAFKQLGKYAFHSFP